MNKDQKPFTYLIELKSSTGQFKDLVRTFQNEKHFTYWYSKMTSYGYKIIGIHEHSHRS